MRTLLLLRHAKSSWADPGQTDFDRPLAPRGREAAARIGRELVERRWVPDRVLVSAAARTRETWALVAAELPSAPQVIVSRSIYEADVQTLLGLIRQDGGDAGVLMVVGHNPSTEALAQGLAGAGSDLDALDRLRRKYPTAGLARFDYDGRWAEIALGKGRLTDFLAPRELDD